MHGIHTSIVARAVFHTCWAQGKSWTGPWKVPQAALQRAQALSGMEQTLLREQSDHRSQFCSKGGWYKMNTKGNGVGKGSDTEYCELGREEGRCERKVG